MARDLAHGAGWRNPLKGAHGARARLIRIAPSSSPPSRSRHRLADQCRLDPLHPVVQRQRRTTDLHGNRQGRRPAVLILPRIVQNHTNAPLTHLREYLFVILFTMLHPAYGLAPPQIRAVQQDNFQAQGPAKAAQRAQFRHSPIQAPPTNRGGRQGQKATSGCSGC